MAQGMRLKTTVVSTENKKIKGVPMLDHLLVVLGLMTAVGAVMATIRPMQRKNPFWI